jgi:hypothetical protein
VPNRWCGGFGIFVALNPVPEESKVVLGMRHKKGSLRSCQWSFLGWAWLSRVLPFEQQTRLQWWVNTLFFANQAPGRFAVNLTCVKIF